MKILLITLLSFAGFIASAQSDLKAIEHSQSVKDTLDIHTLNEIIVKGHTFQNPSFSTYKNILEEKVAQPKNVAGLFDNINGFSVIKRGNYALDPAFRGTQYEQLNLQYDGGLKAMHACPNRMDPITTHIAPEDIEKIEIIKGPYSVRYGASFGGIINLVTRDPGKGPKGFHGSVSSGYESNGQSFLGMTQLQYVGNSFDIIGNLGYRNYGNYKDGNGDVIPSSFKSTDYGLKTGLNLARNHRIMVGWRQSYGRDILHAGLPMDSDYDDSSIASMDYRWDIIGNKAKRLQIKTYYSYVDHLMTNLLRPNAKMMESKAYVTSSTAGAKAELEWKTSELLWFYSGVDFMHISREGNRHTLIKMQNGQPLPEPQKVIVPIWQDAFIQDYGFYTEAKWIIDPSYIFRAGLRYDLVSSDILKPAPDFNELYQLGPRTEHNISGTISIKKAITHQLYLEGAFGRGVRSANMIERYINKFNVGQDNYTYTGNPNLKAESNHQFELGLSGYKYGNGTIEKFSFEVSAYYADIRNYISALINPVFGPNAKTFENIDMAYKTGIEASGRIHFAKAYFIQTDLSYLYAHNRQLDEPLPLIPPFKATIITGIERDKFWGNIRLNLVATQDQVSVSFGEVTTPGYQTIDIKLGINPSEAWSIGIAAINLLNKTYHDHLNFSFRNQEHFSMIPVNEMGRNISAFARFKF
ncbi:MAG: TonB-dependent receptor [Saprospiraceae bacterium]|nr:MAG: outer membrane receptor protein [Bacteroidetes bacterium OLB9]MCO6464233.1 TonB-dependent receptor [Saprospiraceae bacterium]